MAFQYSLSTVPGYSALVPCAQSALVYALNPRFGYYPNCQTGLGSASWATCLCLTAYAGVTSTLDVYHLGCPVVTVWEPKSVFNNFCSVQLRELAPVSAGSTVPDFSQTATRTANTQLTTGTSQPSAGSRLTSDLASPTSLTDSTTSFGAPSPTSSLDGNSRDSTSFPLAAIAVIAIVGVVAVIGLTVCCCCRNRLRRWWQNRGKKDGRSHVFYNNLPPQSTIAGSYHMQRYPPPQQPAPSHVSGFNIPQYPASYPPAPSQISRYSSNPQNRPYYSTGPPSYTSYHYPNMSHSEPLVRPEDSASNVGGPYR